MDNVEVKSIVDKYKSQIKKDEADLNKLEGKSEALLSELKSKYGINDIEQAKKECLKLDKELVNIEKEIEEAIEELLEKYPLDAAFK
jgi:Skp family chaperone for outer membrane proteins